MRSRWSDTSDVCNHKLHPDSTYQYVLNFSKGPPQSGQVLYILSLRPQAYAAPPRLQLLWYSESKWKAELWMLFTALNGHFTISTNDKCGTHIHISKTTGWTLRNIRNLAVGVIKREEEMDDLLPGRVTNIFCKKNSESDVLSRFTAEEKLNHIYGTKSIPDVVLAMCAGIAPLEGESIDEAVERCVMSSFNWNFSYVLKECGTVEFRQADGSPTLPEAVKWVRFTVNFVTDALNRRQDRNVAEFAV